MPYLYNYAFFNFKKLLSKKALKDLLISFLITDENVSTDEYLKHLERSIKAIKRDLNTAYSYLKRLSIPAEQDKLYRSFCRQQTKNNYKNYVDNKILKIYERWVRQMMKSFSNDPVYTEKANRFINAIQYNVNYILQPHLDKTAFINYRKSITQHKINNLKRDLLNFEDLYKNFKELADELNRKIKI